MPASSQSLCLILSLKLYSSCITSRPDIPPVSALFAVEWLAKAWLLERAGSSPLVVYAISIHEPVTSKIYKLACAPIEHSDQPAHPSSLIRVFDGSSLKSWGSNFLQVEKLRLWSDCVTVRMYRMIWTFAVHTYQLVLYTGYHLNCIWAGETMLAKHWVEIQQVAQSATIAHLNVPKDIQDVLQCWPLRHNTVCQLKCSATRPSNNLAGMKQINGQLNIRHSVQGHVTLINHMVLQL